MIAFIINIILFKLFAKWDITWVIECLYIYIFVKMNNLTAKKETYTSLDRASEGEIYAHIGARIARTQSLLTLLEICFYLWFKLLSLVKNSNRWSNWVSKKRHAGSLVMGMVYCQNVWTFSFPFYSC